MGTEKRETERERQNGNEINAYHDRGEQIDMV